MYLHSIKVTSEMTEFKLITCIWGQCSILRTPIPLLSVLPEAVQLVWDLGSPWMAVLTLPPETGTIGTSIEHLESSEVQDRLIVQNWNRHPKSQHPGHNSLSNFGKNTQHLWAHHSDILWESHYLSYSHFRKLKRSVEHVANKGYLILMWFPYLLYVERLCH